MATPTPSPNHLIMAMRDDQINNTTIPQDADTLSACEKVINTVELLDAILLDIVARRSGPNDSSILRGILRLSRVNRAFHNHIHGDTDIAQQLFLAPKANRSKLSLRAKRLWTRAKEHMRRRVHETRPRLPRPPLRFLFYTLLPNQASDPVVGDAILERDVLDATADYRDLGGNPPSHSARSAPPRRGHQVGGSDGDRKGVGQEI